MRFVLLLLVAGMLAGCGSMLNQYPAHPCVRFLGQIAEGSVWVGSPRPPATRPVAPSDSPPSSAE